MSLTSEQKQIAKELTLAALPMLVLRRKTEHSDEDYNRFVAQEISEAFNTIAQGIQSVTESNPRVGRA